MIFLSKSYLTIDDSPSLRMDDLVDYLSSRHIPALFFCRGDLLETNISAAIRAVQKGYVLGNHAYSHQRSSQKEYEWLVDEIEKTEFLIDDIYDDAGVERLGKYFRFPQLDRGAAAWVADFDLYEGATKQDLLATFTQGLNVQSLDCPSEDLFVKKDKLQAYLKSEGYTQPFSGITKPWYQTGELANAYDCLYTFSNCDWMLTQRHLGKWPYKNMDDLKAKARNDNDLTSAGKVNVILAHDQAEIVDVTIELIDDLAANGMEFLPIE